MTDYSETQDPAPLDIPVNDDNNTDLIFEPSIEERPEAHKEYNGLLMKTNPAMFMVMPLSVLTGETSDEASVEGEDFLISSDKFFLTDFMESRTEKYQVMETFGAPSIFFFNERIRTYNLNGQLLDGYYDDDNGLYSSKIKNNLNWADSFKNLYDNYLRATILARNKKICVLTFNDNVIYGYPVSFTLSTGSNSPYINSFSMSFLVVEHKTVSKKIAIKHKLESLKELLGYKDVAEKISAVKDAIKEPTITDSANTSRITTAYQELIGTYIEAKSEMTQKLAELIKELNNNPNQIYVIEAKASTFFDIEIKNKYYLIANRQQTVIDDLILTLQNSGN